MRYASVCDGIGAVHQAWQPLGWECAWTSEIEPFPIAVVEQRWGFPNLGDMTKITQEQLDEHGAIDLLVGGTPCQSFSVAGLRGGLDDARGNLALRFMQLVGVTRPRWVVWENVPGVLSSRCGEPESAPPDRVGVGHGERVVDSCEYDETGDFSGILAALVELGYGFAYRVLDAQYFGLAQRRKRVFVVGCLGDWRRAAAVLFERHSLSGHPAPRRETGTGVAALTARCVGTCGADDNQAQAGHLIHCAEVAPTVDAAFASKWGLDNQHIDSGAGMFVSQTLRGESIAATLGARYDGSPCADRGPDAVVVPAVAFDCKGTDPQPGEVTPTLRSMNYDKSHANAGGQVAVAFNWQAGGSKAMIGGTHNRTDALQASQIPAVAFDLAQITSNVNRTRVSPELPVSTLSSASRMHAATAMAVRRLTPRECERLQGFPDDYSLVTYRNKPAADGPRYRALGNSMAVPVMRWIGERIELIE